jgi:hypothetical protein
MKIAGARAESKRLATRSAIFMLGGAPAAHEVLPDKFVLGLVLFGEFLFVQDKSYRVALADNHT